MSDLSSILSSAGAGALNSIYGAITGNASPASAGGAQPSGGQAPSGGTSTTAVAAVPSTNWGEIALIGGGVAVAIVLVVFLVRK